MLPEGRHGVPVSDLAESDGVIEGENTALGARFRANVRVALMRWVAEAVGMKE